MELIASDTSEGGKSLYGNFHQDLVWWWFPPVFIREGISYEEYSVLEKKSEVDTMGYSHCQPCVRIKGLHLNPCRR